MQGWASARPNNQSFLVVRRECIAAAAAADRAERVFKCFQCFIALFQSSAPSPSLLDNLNFMFISPSSYASIHRSFHQSILIITLFVSLWGCVLSQQHLIRRHVMVRRHQSCKTRRKPCNYCKCVCGAFAQQNAEICPLQVKDGGWFIHPLRTASSLNINPGPSLTLRPMH